MKRPGLSAVFFALFLLASCRLSQKAIPEINTGADSDAMRYGVQWAVVIDPYATFRRESAFSAPVSGHGRRGDVEQVTARAIALNPGDNKAALWYGFEKGWLPAASVAVFANKYKALKTAESMKD